MLPMKLARRTIKRIVEQILDKLVAVDGHKLLPMTKGNSTWLHIFHRLSSTLSNMSIT